MRSFRKSDWKCLLIFFLNLNKQLTSIIEVAIMFICSVIKMSFTRILTNSYLRYSSLLMSSTLSFSLLGYPAFRMCHNNLFYQLFHQMVSVCFNLNSNLSKCPSLHFLLLSFVLHLFYPK